MTLRLHYDISTTGLSTIASPLRPRYDISTTAQAPPPLPLHSISAMTSLPPHRPPLPPSPPLPSPQPPSPSPKHGLTVELTCSAPQHAKVTMTLLLHYNISTTGLSTVASPLRRPLNRPSTSQVLRLHPSSTAAPPQVLSPIDFSSSSPPPLIN